MVSGLLIFERTLWSFLNPLILMGTIYIGYLIILHFIDDKKRKKFKLGIPLLMTGLLLAIYSMKELIYWIAGSVNYVWTFFLVIFTIIYYLKTRMKKHVIFNSLLFLGLGVLHECTFAFAVVFLITIMIIDYIKDKKMDWKKLIYILPIVIGARFLLMAPGNANRMEGFPEWYAMPFIQRMQTAIPELSKLLLNYRNLLNIIPILFTITLIIRIIKQKNKYAYIISGILTLTMLLCLGFQNGWIYFLMVILLFIGENYLNIKQGRWELVAISLSLYAVAYSVVITPLYYSTRPNYFLYIYYIILTVMYIIEVLPANKTIAVNTFTTISALVFITTVVIEIAAYTYIGKIHKERMEALEKAKQENQTEVYLPKIKDNMTVFQMDGNNVLEEGYWAERYYKNLYGIPQEMKIIPYDEK